MTERKEPDETDKVLCFDFTGLKCPLPVLKARRALSDALPGAVIEVVADDPAAPLDFAHFCETAGHKLLSVKEQGPQFHFRIQKQG
ncbi:MAG: sulfurtransferase TusA family protein [Candidatus Puniceispirillaceae bacterium]